VLTKLTIRNFKRFTSAEIELGNPVVFIGPNNSGKTTALQALLPVAGEHRGPAGGVHGSGRVPRADVGPGGP
jgi:predicted ATPase